MPTGSPFYETPEELGHKIDEYIGACASDDGPPPTVAGMAHFLGFASRQSFYDYEKREGFSYIVKRARLFIESQHEVALYGAAVAGSIFWLKNHGWSDKHDVSLDVAPEEIAKLIKVALSDIEATDGVDE